MNQNKSANPHDGTIDYCLNCTKEEQIDFSAIDRKLKYLIQNDHKYYITPKTSFITALVLFALVSILGTYNFYDQKQQQFALEIIEYERQTALNSDYIYSTLVSSYERTSED